MVIELILEILSINLAVLCCRWRYLLTLFLLGVAFAAEDEDSIPDAGVDDSDELALNQEVRFKFKEKK